MHKSITRQPFHTDSYCAASVLLREERFEEAFDALRSEPDESPARVLALGAAALALGALERHDEAEELGHIVLGLIAERGCPFLPSIVQFSRNLAEAIHRQGRRWEAISYFQDAIAKAEQLEAEYPEHRSAIAWERGHTLQALGGALLSAERFEAASDAFRKCRDTYNQFPDEEEVGHAEVLTNFAYACFHLNQPAQAAFALAEASDIARRTRNDRQLQRTLLVAAQHNAMSTATIESAHRIAEAAKQSITEERFPTAYIRFCIAAETAINGGHVKEAQDFIDAALQIEPRLSLTDFGPAKLRLSVARLRERTGGSLDDIINGLVDGAQHWYRRLSNRSLAREDFEGVAESLHDHFRWLARCLFECGRYDEALLSFESGRALAIAKDVAPAFQQELLTNNAFTGSPGKVDCAALRGCCEALHADEVAISIAALPPNVVAFVLARDGVQVVSMAVGTTLQTANQVALDIAMIRHRIPEGVGGRAIPEWLREFGSDVARVVGNRTIRRFVPYAFYHNVPWRTLLRCCGMAWKQLPFCTEFGLLLPFTVCRAETLLSQGVIAMGWGRAGPHDFDHDACEFARHWGTTGRFEADCTSHNAKRVLKGGPSLYLSLHGQYVDHVLLLEFANGLVPAHELVVDNVKAPVVFLSACLSGTYAMAVGDDPIGFAPLVLRQGANRCVCTRWPIRAGFAGEFFSHLAENLSKSSTLEDAFVATLERCELEGADLWRDLACVELVGQS